MIKVFLILIALNICIFGAQQIIVVVSNDFNSSKAVMSCFEGSKKVFSNIDVNIGRNGLAWGVDEKKFQHKENEPLKFEGDGKSPAGVFSITSTFGYEDHNFSVPYIKSDEDRICVDDSNSTFYNKIIKMPDNQLSSFEYMKRDDDQYNIGAVVDYNPHGIKNRGSCIFLHVQKEMGHATAGCTSMRYHDLEKILKWLDPDKTPVLLQIPKSYLEDAEKLFPQIIEKTNDLK